MTPRFITELSEGSRVDATYALRAKELRAARNGDAYLSVRFADRTGFVPGVFFRPSADAVSVPVGAIVQVTGTVTVFKGVKRISVDGMFPAASWDRQDFIPSGPRATKDMVGDFKAVCATVSDPALRRIIRAVFSDSAFFDRFTECPGSQSYHHAYVGGLMEHTIAVARICDEAASRYHGVERDLLVTAALVHDIGKVDELTYDSSIGYSDTGRLVGHVVLGVQRLAACAAKIKMDSGVLVRLEHAVLSHHGELEWGSPKRPSTIEALLLHHADNLDAKAEGFSSLLSGAIRSDERWTDSENLFRRPLYAPRPAEDDRHHVVDEDAQGYRLTA